MPGVATPACRSIGAVVKWRTPKPATRTRIGERSIRRRRTCRGTPISKPGDKYLDPFESPRNNNWYLLTLGARRGLTFLEQQPEVDADHLGVYGHSMGGNLTVYVAGTDNRVKAAAPSVGGSGFRSEPWPLLPQVKLERPNGDVRLFKATLGFESYAPQIKRSAAVAGIDQRLPRDHGRHLPHRRVDPAQERPLLVHAAHEPSVHTGVRRDEAALVRPIPQGRALPSRRTPDSKLVLATDDHVAELQVTPDSSQAVAEVHVYYSVDPDPRARFWRSAEVREDGQTPGRPSCRSCRVDQPFFAFANVAYRIEEDRVGAVRPADRTLCDQFSRCTRRCPEGPATQRK